MLGVEKDPSLALRHMEPQIGQVLKVWAPEASAPCSLCCGAGGGVGAENDSGCEEVPFSFGGAEQVAWELKDAVTEPKVVVLGCSGENFVCPSLPPIKTMFEMLGTGLCSSNSPGLKSLQAEGLWVWPGWRRAGQGTWRRARPGHLTEAVVYPCRNYSAVCVYSLGDIDRVFRTSSLKGYHMGLPNPRPGMVSS